MKKWIAFLVVCAVLLGFWFLIVDDKNTPDTVQTFTTGNGSEETIATEASFSDTDLSQYADYYVPTGRELTEEEAIERGLITAEETQEVIAVEDNEEPYVIMYPDDPSNCPPPIPEPIPAPGTEETYEVIVTPSPNVDDFNCPPPIPEPIPAPSTEG